MQESQNLSLTSLDLPFPAANPALLEALVQPRLTLFWGAQTPARPLLAALTVLAVRGTPVRVFDGGNRFDGYFVARLARRLCGGRPQADPHAVLGRIRLSRAFTCFQLAELIENTPAVPLSGGASWRSTPDAVSGEKRLGEAPTSLFGAEPLFVLDLLATFYDESVPLRDVERLLATTITHLKRLAAVGPVIVAAREPQSLVKERWALLDRLQVAADGSWMLRAPEAERSPQPSLLSDIGAWGPRRLGVRVPKRQSV